MSDRIRSPGRDRRHRYPRRQRVLRLRLGDDEYDDIAAAARIAGLTPSGYAAETAVAAARGRRKALPDVALIQELLAARAQLRRYGNNVNQAARILNAGGDPPEWLDQATTMTNRVVMRIDRVVCVLASVC